MAKFTFLEVHLDGATLTASAPFGGEDAESDSTGPTPGSGTGGETDTGIETGSESGPRVAPILFGLVALVVVAVVLRRLIGGADEEILDEESESD